MATSLYVRANTGQAVAAFDMLTAAIDRAHGKFDRLHVSLNAATTVNNRYANSITNGIERAFDRLVNIAQTVVGAVTAVAVGMGFVFNSILKEMDKIQGFNSIMSVTTKSSDATGKSFSFLRGIADTLGVQFDSLASNYAKLVAALPAGNEQMSIAERVFTGVAMAARTLHASNQDTQLMFYAITQIASKGVVSMEELRRQLGEKLPGALQIAARGLNTTTTELEAAIRKGIVDSAKFLPTFGDALIRTFADSSVIASKTLSAAVNRLTNVWVDFVKAILDSGAGDAIVRIFDNLREKLSDPYIIGRFAELVRELSNRIADFIQGLTADDLRKGFDTFYRLASITLTILEKLAAVMEWIVNNTGKVGAGMGALAGAGIGASIGTAIAPGVGTAIGAGAGALVGLAGGAWGGSQFSQTAEQRSAMMQMEDRARQAAEATAAEQTKIRQQYLEPLLKLFQIPAQVVPNLFQSSRLNMDTISQLTAIFSDKRFPTLGDQQKAVLDLNRYGRVLEPQTKTLKDVLGGKSKDAEKDAKALQKQFLEGVGLKGDFYEDWNRIIKLYKDGKYSMDEMIDAQDRLLGQQPAIREYRKEQEKVQAHINQQLSQEVDRITKLVDAREDFVRSNQEFLVAQEAVGISSGLSSRQRYVNEGLAPFDQAADELRKQASSKYELDWMNRMIDAQRMLRKVALENSFDEQIKGVTGLRTAYTEFFDLVENEAQAAANGFRNIVGSMQSAWENFVVTGKISIEGFVRTIQMEIAKITWNRYIGPLAANLGASIVGALFGFERGGIMTSAGPLPLRTYSGGGVADSPQVALFGEGRMNEAYVPLPDGRSIPVTMKGGGVNIVQNIHIGDGVNASQVVAAARSAKEAAVAEIRDMINRRGL